MRALLVQPIILEGRKGFVICIILHRLRSLELLQRNVSKQIQKTYKKANLNDLYIYWTT